MLREFEGLSYREIGERLDMSRASVESTLFRARRRLTEEYDELVSGERCGRVQGLIATAEVARPGLRDQRRLRAHLSHCQPCRRSARLAGLDDALFVAPRGVRAKVAAFFPLPAFLQRRWGGASSPVPSGRGATLAQLTAQYGTSVDPYVGTSWTKAAAAAATLAVAGVAGGHAVSDGSHELFGGATPQRNEASSPRSLATSGPRAASGSATGAATPVVRSSGAAPGSGAATPPARRSSGPSERGGPKRAGTAPTRAAAAASPAPVASAAQPQAAVGALMPKVAVPSTPPATKPAADSDVAVGAAKVGREEGRVRHEGGGQRRNDRRRRRAAGPDGNREWGDRRDHPRRTARAAHIRCTAHPGLTGPPDRAGHAGTGGLMAGDPDPDAFLESLTDTSLYSIGAYFSDQHPDLVDDVLAQSEQIESLGLERWAAQDGVDVEQAFQTLMTGLALRYFGAVAGEGA